MLPWVQCCCFFLHQQVILYEEEMGNHNENTGEKLHLAQEQLALAGDKILSLERSLNLYRDKYQTSLSNIELLECQVKMLEGELSRIVGQVGLKPNHSDQELPGGPCNSPSLSARNPNLQPVVIPSLEFCSPQLWTSSLHISCKIAP